MDKSGTNKNDQSYSIQAKLNEEEKNEEMEDSEDTKKSFYSVLILVSVVTLAIIYFVLYVVMAPKPEPPRPIPIEENPYKIVYSEYISDKVINLVLYNQRTNPSSVSDKGKTIFISSDTNANDEPLYLNATFTFVDSYLIEFKLIDANLTRINIDLLYHSQSEDASIYAFNNYNFSKLGIQFFNDPFGFSLFDPALSANNSIPIISTMNNKMAFFDNYIEFEATLQTPRIYGMLDHGDSFNLKSGINYTLWNTNDHSFEAALPRQSSHPFLLAQLQNSQFIGVFLHNNNAIQFEILPHTKNTNAIWRISGGIVHMFFILPSSAEFVTKKFHSIIGYPYPIPLWAMGFHHQNDSDMNVNDLNKTVNLYIDSNMPLESIATGLNFSDHGKLFSIGDNFKGIDKFVDMLHDKNNIYNIKFIISIIPGIITNNSYNYSQFIRGNKSGIVNCNLNEGLLIGNSSYGEVYIPDFFNPNMNNIWIDGLKDLHSLVNFDGVVLLENEPGIKSKVENNSVETLCKQYDNLSFSSMNFGFKSIPITSRYNIPGISIDLTSDYNLHNYYSISSIDKTYRALMHNISNTTQPFVISYSSGPGAGHVSAYSTGKNNASWKSMKESILSILNYNLFGLTHSGASIGGYEGPLNDELYIRWYQLGAFYPLARINSYGDSGPNSRSPVGRSKNITEFAFNSLKLRYGLLRFYFTKMVESYLWGGPVVHPLFFDFPSDDNCFVDDVVDNSFVIGHEIYVNPILEEGQTELTVYFPNARWYELISFNLIKEYDPNSKDLGSFQTFSVNLNQIKFYLKGGAIIPFQNVIQQYRIQNTVDLENSPLILIIAPDFYGRAQGSMVFTNSSIFMKPSPTSDTYKHYSLYYCDGILKFNQIAGFNMNDISTTENFDMLVIENFNPDKDVEFACILDNDLNVFELEFSQVRSKKTVSIFKKEGDTNTYYFSQIESIIFGGKMDHNFCNSGIKVISTKYFNNNREMVSNLQTSDMNSISISYTLNAKLLTDKMISIKITRNDDINPWIVPDAIDENVRNNVNSSFSLNDFGFSIAKETKNFFFEINNTDNPNEFIFSTKNFQLFFQKNYINMKSLIKSKHLFGLGERILKFDIPDGIYTLFSRSDDSSTGSDENLGNNLYSQHPFYICQLIDSQQYIGVLILTSNPMDVKVQHLGLLIEVDHIITGNTLDMFIISKGTYLEVLQTYNFLVGKGYMVPYWAFGYHQSRWGYNSIDKLNDTYNKLIENSLPFDSIWSDLDILKDNQNFLINNISFPSLNNWIINKLVDTGRHYIPLVLPSIPLQKDNLIYENAIQNKILILSNKTKKPLVGISWQGYSVYPDFVHPEAQSFWDECLSILAKQVFFSGIWLNYNEPLNFCDGECDEGEQFISHFFNSVYYDDVVYIPGHKILEKKTLSMDALHFTNNQGKSQIEFNLHSMYGFYESKAAYSYFKNYKKERPFILSRSTFIGSGKYASHWLGNNFSTWESIKYSISGILNANLVGILHTGADVCGFYGSYDFELCARWYQLGAFYPFFRNHNFINSSSKEPFIEPALMTVFKQSMNIRYGIMRFLYSLYYEASQYGGMLLKPFLFEFPNDPYSYDFIDTSFMLGSNILISPVLNPGITKMTIYMPNDNWFDIKGNQIYYRNSSRLEGGNITLDVSLPSQPIPWFIREGSILPWQERNSSMSSFEMLNKPINLIIIRNASSKTSYGKLYYDHDDPNTLENLQFHYIKITYTSKNNILFEIEKNRNFIYEGNSTFVDENVDSILIFNSEDLKNVQCVTQYNEKYGRFINLNFIYDSARKISFITKMTAQIENINVRYTKNITLSNDKCSSITKFKDNNLEMKNDSN